MDRQLINGSKAICLTGSQASWPIGLEDAKSYPCIALCEGEMDFLAAFGHAYASGVEDQVAPVCMSGASNRIPNGAIPLFRDKRVRIFVQADRAGEDASNRWYNQIKHVASSVDGFDFADYTMEPDETVVTDLNDLLRVSSDCWEQHREEIESVMNF
jgi:DNA primase